MATTINFLNARVEKKGYARNLCPGDRGIDMARQLKRNTGLILALDIDDRKTAIDMADSVEEYIDMIKISWASFGNIFLKDKVNIIEDLKAHTELPILACFKVCDVPHMSRKIAEMAINAGSDALTLMGIVGDDSMKECVKLAKEREVGTYIVAEMSHPGGERYIQQHAEDIARMAKSIGATGIVAPATHPSRVKALREIVGKEMIILSPGVGAQGGRAGDAILAGADFEIVGRSIYESKNPRETAQKISSQVKQAIKKSLVYA